MNRFDKRLAWAGVLLGFVLAVIYLCGCGDTYVGDYPQPPSGYVYSNDGYLIPVNPGIGFVYVGGGHYRYQNRLVYIDRPGHVVTTPPRQVTINVNSSSKRSGGFNTSAPSSSTSSGTRVSGGFNRSTTSTYSRPSSTSTFTRSYAPVSRPSYSAPSVSRSSGGFRR